MSQSKPYKVVEQSLLLLRRHLILQSSNFPNNPFVPKYPSAQSILREKLRFSLNSIHFQVGISPVIPRVDDIPSLSAGGNVPLKLLGSPHVGRCRCKHVSLLER